MSCMGSWLCLPISFIFMERSEKIQGFHGGSDGKESACNAGDLGSIPGVGYTVHGVTKSWTQLSD